MKNLSYRVYIKIYLKFFIAHNNGKSDFMGLNHKEIFTLSDFS